jgi:hypothetical protein
VGREGGKARCDLPDVQVVDVGHTHVVREARSNQGWLVHDQDPEDEQGCSVEAPRESPLA